MATIHMPVNSSQPRSQNWWDIAYYLKNLDFHYTPIVMDDQFLEKVEMMRGVMKSLQDLVSLILDFLLSTAFHTDEAKLLQPKIVILLL